MMKNISKLAALAVATAFLLAGFPACSGDDDDGGNGGVPTTDTVTPASFELTSGAEAATKDFTLTLVTTQIKEDKLADLKANTDLTEQKADIVTQSEGDHITVSALKVTDDATATTLKLSVTMASSAAAGTTGTLMLTLPATYTANGETIAQTVRYTIEGNTTTPDPETPSGKTTTGSWDFANQADTVDWVAKFKTNTVTNTNDGTLSLDKSGDIPIASEALDADTDGLTLTILAAKPWNSATNPNYSYAEPASGLRIKNPALKIAGVKGKVKVTIAWECIHSKGEGDRKLQLLQNGGTVIKEVGNEATTSASSGNVAMTVFEATVSHDEATDLYIGGTNNIFIKSVKVENAADAVTTATLKAPNAQGDYTDDGALTFELGNTKLSATALNTAIKASADEKVTAAVGNAVAALQAETNEALGDNAFTVTKAQLDFVFAESEAKIESEEYLEEITGGSTVYVSFKPNDVYTEAYEAATVTGVNAKWEFTATAANAAPWLTELAASGANWKFDNDSDVKGKVQDESGVSITPTTGSGATFTFLKTSKSIESGGSNGWKTGTATVADYNAYATLTVTDSCTVTITGKDGGGSKTDGTVRGFSVNDGEDDVVSYAQEGSSSANFTKTFSAVVGKTYTIKAGGVNFYTIACTPAEEQ